MIVKMTATACAPPVAPIVGPPMVWPPYAIVAVSPELSNVRAGGESEPDVASVVAPDVSLSESTIGVAYVPTIVSPLASSAVTVNGVAGNAVPASAAGKPLRRTLLATPSSVTASVLSLPGLSVTATFVAVERRCAVVGIVPLDGAASYVSIVAVYPPSGAFTVTLQRSGVPEHRGSAGVRSIVCVNGDGPANATVM